MTVYSETKGPPRMAGPGLGKAIGIVVLVIIVAVGGGIAFVAKRIFDTTEDVRQDFVDLPDGFDLTPGDIGAGTNPATDFDSCIKLLNKYLRKVLADDGQPADLTNVLQNGASEMGVGSYEFRTFTTIYSSTAGTAVTDGTKAAMKQAKKETREACEREYGG